MSKPIVAIIGKPNVGKSRFFNYVVGQRISIVEDTPGVTRDIVYADTSWRDNDRDGLPRWPSGYGFDFQRRGQGFVPWSRN